jgi:hypothetical protein
MTAKCDRASSAAKITPMDKPKPISLGSACAWQDDAGHWRYAPYKLMAPPDAIEVLRIAVDGKIVLYPAQGGGGQFIRGAVQVG